MKKPSPKLLALAARLVLGVLLLAVAGGVVRFLYETRPQVDTSELQAQSIGVQVLRVEPVAVPRQWRGYGTAQAKNTVDLPARVNATILDIPITIEVGSVVAHGDVIAQLDATDYETALAAAKGRVAEVQAIDKQLKTERESLQRRLKIEQANLELAAAEFKRQADRFAVGSATQSDVDRAKTLLNNAESAVETIRLQLEPIEARLLAAEAALEAARAEQTTAQTNLDRTVIVSPIAGVVEALDIEVGEIVTAGMRVARIVDPHTLEVPLRLPAAARSFVSRDNPVTLVTRSQPDDCPPWNATITRISVDNDPTRTFTVFAEVDQSHVPLRNFAEGGGPYKLPVGAFTLARLETTDTTERTILPARAIQEGRVRTVVDGAVVGKPVEVAFEIEGNFPRFGVNDRQWVALKTPLEPGELVVLSAAMTILDGQRVEPTITNDRAEQQAARTPDQPETERGDAP